jgi:hypothetical protein
VAAQVTANTALRFLPARKVRIGACHFEKFAVKNESGERIGALAGFIVDPGARKTHHAVVHPRGLFAQPCLVPIPGIRINAESETLFVDGPLSRCEPFDRSRYPEFSDEDVMTAVFAAA